MRTRHGHYDSWAMGAVAMSIACGSASSRAPQPSGSEVPSGSGNGAPSGQAASAGSGNAGPSSPDPEATLVGQIDAAASNGLPPLPPLTNVIATVREDSAGIDFDPFDGAVDYRVYVLPDASDVTVNADGSLAIKNAVYRCAGMRQTYDLPNGVNVPASGCPGYKYTGPLAFGPNQQCPWPATISSNPTLGYVSVLPDTGLVPVFAIGVHPTAPEVGWRETRPKIYTTDATERASLIAQGGRDDGIAFYAPAAAGATTQTVYHSATNSDEYYFGDADMATHAMDSNAPAPAFQVFAAGAAGTQPLMAVFYAPGQNHTELAVGKERFTRASAQGVGPMWHLEWSGITQPTTLVIEALTSGCAYPGLLSAQPLMAQGHQPFYTFAQLQQKSSTGEVYINGQYDLPGSVDSGATYLETPNTSPVPIARSLVQVAPIPHDPNAWDWYEGFPPGTDLGTATAASACTENGIPGYNCVHYQTSEFDISGYRLDVPTGGPPVFTYGTLLGQLWTVFDDAGGDVTGKIRVAPLKTTTIDADASTYLHVTWSVTAVGTDRRYPQLLVSDQPLPVQGGLSNPNNNTLLLQTIEGPSVRFEAQAIHGLVNGMQWDVNNQAPHHSIVDYDGWMTSPSVTTIPPAPPPFEHIGLDRMTKFDAYISSQRVYAFIDDLPAGCMQLPSTGFALKGQVTVTFGDVLYHELAESIDLGVRPFPFMHEHECFETERHWDDLGFKAGVTQPVWNDVLFPCEPY